MRVNGVWCLAIMAALAAFIVAAMAAIVIANHTIPNELTGALLILVGAVGGGGIVNRVNATTTVDTAEAAASKAVDAFVSHPTTSVTIDKGTP